MANDPKANESAPTGDWRELARQIETEPDSQKMIELVQQLIGKFDEEVARKNPPRSADPKSSSSPDA
jgi:hypothetical protein